MLRLVALIGLTLGLVGCVGYTTYPPPGEGTGSGDAAFNSPNIPPAPEVIAVALRHIVERYPVAGAYALNLPAELSAKKSRRISKLLDDPKAQPLTSQTQTLPIYHVARIWIRGASAEVDIFRPVTDIPGPPGVPVSQLVTLSLKSNLARWRVVSTRSSAIGVASPPPLHFQTIADAQATAADSGDN